MNLQRKHDDTAGRVDKFMQKYVERKKQLPPSEDINSGARYEAVQRRPIRNMKGYSEALHELFKAVTHHPDHSDRLSLGSNEDVSEDFTAAHIQDSQALLTETDVTLPSCLDGSPGSQETETNDKFLRAYRLPASSRSSSLNLAEVYQEMVTISGQLRAERRGQQLWERELQERERRLEQQEEALRKKASLEEMLQSGILAVKEKHQQEVSQLQDLLRERSKENKRLKSSFDTIKDLNDNMKKQLQEVSKQNEKLESQSKRVQARLDNLQRKHEHSTAPRARQRANVKSAECTKPSGKEKSAASGNPSNKRGSGHTSTKLLALLLDWVLDGRSFSSAARNNGRGVDQRLPPEVVLNERCLKGLPLLADQLHHTPPSEAELLLNLLRLIHWALRHMDSSPLRGALSATLRRIGEQVSKPSAQFTVSDSDDPDPPKSCSVTAAGPEPCRHTRILSALIVLRTVTQADVLALALDSLHTELMSEESRGLFIHYDGVCELMSMLRGGRGGLHKPVDILMELTQQSCYLKPFLEACSCEEFFHTTSKILKSPRLELPSLEKLSILLQKLSNIRKNRRLFDISSLHLQIQELYNDTNRTHTFLRLNLKSILHNLQSHTSAC